MKKTLFYRAIVFGLIVVVTTNPVRAGIAVTIVTPISPSSRTDFSTVIGTGKVTIVADAIGNYQWRFGFGSKDMMGQWNPDLELQIDLNNATNQNNVSNTSWVKQLNAPPWILSPIVPGMNMRMPDHFGRVTIKRILDNQEFVFENNQHTVHI